MRPISHRVRRGAAGLAGVACLLGVGACGTNFEAQTNQPYQAAAGSNERAPGVDIMNMLAVENTDGTATVSASLINKSGEDDSITGVSATDEGNDIDVELSEPVPLPEGETVQLGEQPEIVISDEDLSAGYYANLTLQFDSIAPIEIQIPVVDRGENGMYDGIAEAPAPEPEDAGER